MGGDVVFFIRNIKLVASMRNITSVRLPMWPDCSPEKEIETRERTEKIERKEAEEEEEEEAEEEEEEAEVVMVTTINRGQELMVS